MADLPELSVEIFAEARPMQVSSPGTWAMISSMAIRPCNAFCLDPYETEHGIPLQYIDRVHRGPATACKGHTGHDVAGQPNRDVPGDERAERLCRRDASGGASNALNPFCIRTSPQSTSTRKHPDTPTDPRASPQTARQPWRICLFVRLFSSSMSPFLMASIIKWCSWPDCSMRVRVRHCETGADEVRWRISVIRSTSS